MDNVRIALDGIWLTQAAAAMLNTGLAQPGFGLALVESDNERRRAPGHT
jgi:hypothetical protein